MSFINPVFLWALFALTIPILIHLFHFRRYKTVYFSNVNFLKEVKQERNNIRKLKRWLLLASRMLAILFLVLAFARPFLKGKDAADQGNNAVSIYLDNSYSMGLKHKGVELLEWGRDRAGEIIGAYGDMDEFMILTNDLKVEEQRWKSRQDALNYLDGISISANALPLERILEKQDYLFSRATADHARQYIVSDFQESMIDGASLPADSSRSTYFFQLEADDVRNLYIDSVWMREPVSRTGGSSSILYRVVNSSPLDAAGVRVTLTVNDQVQSIRELNLIAGEQRTDTLYYNIYKPGWQLGEIALSDYPISIDDEFYFSFPVEERQNILEVADNSSADAIRRIFADDERISLVRSRSDRLNYSSFNDYGLIVLNEVQSISSGLAVALAKFAGAGGNILLIPSSAPDIPSYNSLLDELAGIGLDAMKEGSYKMARPDLNNVLLSDIVERYPENTDVPEIRKYYPARVTSRTRERRLLSLNNGEALLTWFPLERGNLFYQAVPSGEDFSDFQRNWLYAPVIYNLALFRGLDHNMFTSSDRGRWIAVDEQPERKDNVVLLSGDELDFIPEQRMVDNRLLIYSGRNEHVPAGHYSAEMNDHTMAWISYNTNRQESEMKFPGAEQLRAQFPEAAEIVSGMQETLVAGIRFRNEGRPLWRYCLALAIFFLIAEVAITKWIPD